MKRKNVYIGKDVILGKNVKIESNVSVEGNSRICDNVTIGFGSVLKDVVVDENSVIEHSVITNSTIGKRCKIGPFSHIRPGNFIGDDVKVGSFVEIKGSIVGNGTKIPHLAYVGDAEIGENVNVGCGVVFANYNGKIKQKSKVGSNVFIGCNVNIVAPVKISDNTYICAGTTVTNDTACGDFVIGRVRQENKKRQWSLLFFIPFFL